MDELLITWLALIARWAHVVTGAAWIGASFYFNWLNDSLDPPDPAEARVGGQLWAVHGGAFYHVRKFKVAPERIPERLHWFKWEAYFTWMTGIALLVLVYYLNAKSWVLAPGSTLGAPAAVAIGLGSLAAGWVVYDRLCRSLLVRSEWLFLGVLFLLVAGSAFGLSQVMNGRSAYMHVGAMLGTIMAANVFFVIIPSQRQLVDAGKAGREPDAAVGQHAALRSRHNNYFTLPVLFVMVSNHFPATFGHASGWLILVALSVIGAGVRHWFNVRHAGRAPAWVLPAAAAGIVITALVSAPRRSATDDAPAAGFAQARAVIERRCVPCHSAVPTGEWYSVPPLGVAFDTPDEIVSQKERIRAQSVESEVMPLGNLTGMTKAERDLLGAWIAAGAPR